MGGRARWRRASFSCSCVRARAGVERHDNVPDDGLDLRVEILHLGVRGKEDALGGDGALGKVLVQHGELLRAVDGRAAADVALVEQVAKLAEDVRRDLDGRLVRDGRLHGVVHARGRVLLQVLVVRDDLHDAVPDLVRHGVAGDGEELHDRVDVPAQVRREALGEDGELEHHLVLDGEVGDGEVGEELLDDGLGDGAVAHGEEEVECAAADGDVRVLEREHDRRLLAADGLAAALELGHLRHRVEAQVADVRLADVDELGQVRDGARAQAGVAGLALLDDQRHGLEQNAVLGIVAVDVLRHLRLREDVADDLVHARAHGLVGGHRQLLQQLERAHLQPRAWDAVVHVLVGQLLVHCQTRQPDEHVARDELVRGGLALGEAEDERHRRQHDADVLVFQQAAELLRPLRRRHEVARDADKAQQTERCLLADDGEDSAGEQDSQDTWRDGLGELLAAEVGDRAQSQTLNHVRRRLEVTLDCSNDEGHLRVRIAHENGERHVAHELVRVLRARHK